MNIRHYIYSSIVATLLLSGCADDPFNKYHSPTEGEISVQIKLNTPSGSIITTRAADDPLKDEKILNTAVVMIFDKVTDDATLLQKPVKVDINTTTLAATAKIYAAKNCYVCAIANISDEQINKLLALGIGQPLSEIRTIVTQSIDKRDNFIGISYPLPMSGWSDFREDISTTNKNVTISLTRSVARIDIDGIPTETTSDNFIVTGIRVANGAPSGYVLPQPILPLWDATEVETYTYVDNGADQTSMQGKAYCFENRGSIGDTPNPTRIVVCGHTAGLSTSTYYPIDIIYDKTTTTTEGVSTTKKSYDIERNKTYTIKFNSVKKTGYGSFEEAAKSEAFNTMVDAEIIVTDPYAYDIMTNGRQYLGVTNAEFVIYPAVNVNDKDIKNVHITTLSYTSDPYWKDGDIKCSEGISLAAGAYPRLNVRGDASPSYRDIVVDISKGTTSGTVTLQIGNLMKEIKVRVGAPTPTVGTVIEDYFVTSGNAKSDFKVGEIIAPTEDTSWLKVSTSNEDTGNSSLNDKVTNPDGGIYLHVQPNIGFELGTTAREASSYIAGEKDNQRIKITVQQNSYDVYYDNKPLEPYSYVGTFHRWNQIGERLIRIDASTPQSVPDTDTGGKFTVAWWEATVVAGREFIVLDTEKSSDTKVHIYKNNDDKTPNPYGEEDDPTFTSDDEYVEQYQVESKLRSVKGTGSYIYFRVGLTGKLSSAKAQPRYGLITISYGTLPGIIRGTHNIYVRQGEAADYLMRPWDPSIKPKTKKNELPKENEFPSGTRPLAVKLGVYNLTDPTPEETMNTKGFINRGTRGYIFTQYPSQGGYLFPVSGAYAVDPRLGKAKVSADMDVPDYTTNAWDDAWETCPKGYRRPSDGKTREILRGEDNKNKYDYDIKESEVRQSLWLFPRKGAERSDFSNQITGYIADGYFDRHPIEQIEEYLTSEKPLPRGVVRKMTPDAAYRGYLVFNPNNYASIFLPFSGMYHEATSPEGCLYFGGEGYMSTRTSGGGRADWIVAFGYISTSPSSNNGFVFDNYSSTSSRASYAVRCIKDELSPAITDSTNISIPTEDPNKPMVANFSYDSKLRTLQGAIKGMYSADDQLRINCLAINVVTELTEEDYTYLNAWANEAGKQLHHIVVRGYDYKTLPANAFTSPNWYSISLVDISQISDNAFTSSLTGLTNLSLPYLDGIIANSSAFSFNTNKVQLHLSGKDYSAANTTSNSWKNKTWKAIKQYY